MKIRMLLLMLLILLCATTAMAASSPAVVVYAQVNTHTLLYRDARPGVVPPSLLFTSERPRVTVQTWVSPLHIGASRGERVLLPTTDWWSLLVWKLQSSTGTTSTYGPADVTVVRHWVQREGPPADGAAIHDDEVLYAECELPALTAGEYTLRLELHLPEVASQPASIVTSEYSRFAVRRGDQDPDTLGTYLRWEADQVIAQPAPDRFDRFRHIMLELAALEPASPMPYERLADASIGVTPVNETSGYYEQALRISEQNLTRQFGPATAWSDDIRELWTQRSSALTAFARAVRQYNATTDDVRFHVENRGPKKEITIFRGNKAIGRIE